MLQRPQISAVLGLALCALFSGGALAQSAYPARPVTLVVPFPAGGPPTCSAALPAKR